MALQLYFFFLMLRRPPRSTRTDTLFPYTTLFRSLLIDSARLLAVTMISPAPRLSLCGASAAADWAAGCSAGASLWANAGEQKQRSATPDAYKLMPCRFVVLSGLTIITRSEERRVGKEGVSTSRSRWSPDQ